MSRWLPERRFGFGRSGRVVLVGRWSARLHTESGPPDAVVLSGDPAPDFTTSQHWLPLASLFERSKPQARATAIVVDPTVSPVLWIESRTAMSRPAFQVFATAAMKDFLGTLAGVYRIAVAPVDTSGSSTGYGALVSALPVALQRRIDEIAQGASWARTEVMPMLSRACELASRHPAWHGSGSVVFRGHESAGAITLQRDRVVRMTVPRWIGDRADEPENGEDRPAHSDGPILLVDFGTAPGSAWPQVRTVGR